MPRVIVSVLHWFHIQAMRGYNNPRENFLCPYSELMRVINYLSAYTAQSLIKRKIKITSNTVHMQSDSNTNFCPTQLPFCLFL